MRRIPILLLFSIVLAMLGNGPALSRDLSFQERIEAQRAIERVYYSHQIGVSQPFEEAAPSSLLERKVRDSLKQSVALETLWRTPVTREALQKELERIESGTRFPERLKEIYAALGNDAFLIQECFVRPILVDRLSRNFLAYDDRAQAVSRKALLHVRDALSSGRDTSGSEGIRTTTVEIVKGSKGGRVGGQRPDLSGEGNRRVELDSEEFDRVRSQAPARAGELGPIIEERSAFVLRTVLREDAGSAVLATYSSPKLSWDAWWSRQEAAFDETLSHAVAGDDRDLSIAISQSAIEPLSPCGNDSWQDSRLDDAPHPLMLHTAVWTGSLMIVWGGYSFHGPRGEGWRYDPLTDTWSEVSSFGAPEPRTEHTAVWTGTEMIIWGGRTDSGLTSSGGRYNPSTDTWAATAPIGFTGRRDHVAVWTGSRMIIWGGSEGSAGTNTGAFYDPVTNFWTSITTTTGAPPATQNQTAVWTGTRMIVWGGRTSDSGTLLATGGIYDPVADAWTSTSLTGAPTGRFGHTAVWTGTHMIVWGGGSTSTVTNSGGRYDPGTNTWTPLSTLNAPQGRKNHGAIWTGSIMVVWGGSNAVGYPNTGFPAAGGRYDPAADSWQPASTVNSPAGRNGNTAIWTGSRMVVWGGDDNDNIYGVNTGGRYDPSADAWTPTFSETPPGQRQYHTAVWTGTHMIVWGGLGGRSSPSLDTGARYDPLADAWTATSTTNAPSPRNHHMAVWTGTRMIVFGGNTPSGSFLNTGGEYDPATDSWVPTATTFDFRAGGAAVWTGSRMLMWGGSLDNFVSIYDPAARTWANSSTVNAPPQVNGGNTGVWTGTEMIVWGGYDNQDSSGVARGGRYNPATDSWSSVTTSNAPTARLAHTAVWTGTEMILWGGDALGNPTDTGGVYDPARDRWTDTSLNNAPIPRIEHSAVWTGTEMLIWGGAEWFFNPGYRSGGRYDPSSNSWSDISTIDAPLGSSRHTAVWTGTEMLTWGGQDDDTVLSGGGRYVPIGQQDTDADQDGVGACSGDCDDSNPNVHPGALETCNGIDDDCDASVDEGADAECADSDPCTVDTCGGVEGCQHASAADGTPCDDSNACTAVDQCQAGVCVGSEPGPPEGAPAVSVSVSPAVLSKSNHKMVNITATVTAQDSCGTPIGVVLLSVTSSEPDDIPGNSDGNTVNDIQGVQLGTADFSFQLRAERDRNGPGRTYTVTYAATDSVGQTSEGSATVFVPVKKGGAVPQPKSGRTKPSPK